MQSTSPQIEDRNFGRVGRKEAVSCCHVYFGSFGISWDGKELGHGSFEVQVLLPLKYRIIGMTLGELSVCEDAALSLLVYARRIDRIPSKVEMGKIRSA